MDSMDSASNPPARFGLSHWPFYLEATALAALLVLAAVHVAGFS